MKSCHLDPTGMSLRASIQPGITLATGNAAGFPVRSELSNSPAASRPISGRRARRLAQSWSRSAISRASSGSMAAARVRQSDYTGSGSRCRRPAADSRYSLHFAGKQRSGLASPELKRYDPFRKDATTLSQSWLA